MHLELIRMQNKCCWDPAEGGRADLQTGRTSARRLAGPTSASCWQTMKLASWSLVLVIWETATLTLDGWPAAFIAAF